MRITELRCLECRDKGYIVSYWQYTGNNTKDGYVPGGFRVECNCKKVKS